MGKNYSVGDNLFVRSNAFVTKDGIVPTIQLLIGQSKPLTMGLFKMETILDNADALRKIVAELRATNVGAEEIAVATQALARNAGEMGIVAPSVTAPVVSAPVQSENEKKILELQEQLKKLQAPIETEGERQIRLLQEQIEKLRASNVAPVVSGATKLAQAKEIAKEIGAPKTERVTRGVPVSIAFVFNGKNVKIDAKNKQDATRKLVEMGAIKLTSNQQLDYDAGATIVGGSHLFDTFVKKLQSA